jgi:hypothetical protein
VREAVSALWSSAERDSSSAHPLPATRAPAAEKWVSVGGAPGAEILE